MAQTVIPLARTGYRPIGIWEGRGCIPGEIARSRFLPNPSMRVAVQTKFGIARILVIVSMDKCGWGKQEGIGKLHEE